jgi:hypothetical protein
LLYRLVLADYSPDVARRTAAFITVSPAAVYFTAVYPTALLLLGVAGCFLALRQERWALAGVAGLFAAVAQVPGCLLVLPYAWEYLVRRRGRIGPSALWVLLIPLRPGLWLAYLWTLTGDLLAPVSAAYALWPHRSAWPWDTIVSQALRIFANPAHHALGLVNLAATGLAIAASLWALAVRRASWGL